jgi:hypothetical protein
VLVTAGEFLIGLYSGKNYVGERVFWIYSAAIILLLEAESASILVLAICEKEKRVDKKNGGRS